ncbi:MAG: Hsp20/alpha crystallin family protein [Parachlamydia sp.]|jgi:HSP20 family protein|nr:Hsp20/alpha crystallin family protein [Parachlamydia sp.]
MDDRGKQLIPRSFFRFPSSFPNIWEEMEGKMNQWMGWGSETGVTVSEDNDKVYIEAQLPGMKAEELDISVHQNTLWIKADRKDEQEDKERKFYRRARNSFFYQVELPSAVEEISEKANYKDGVLSIEFKKTQQNQRRKIAVQGDEKTS